MNINQLSDVQHIVIGSKNEFSANEMTTPPKLKHETYELVYIAKLSFSEPRIWKPVQVSDIAPQRYKQEPFLGNLIGL